MTGLYIHIPFCRSKCYYCDFYSVTGSTELIPAFINALCQEARLYSGAVVDTLYVGGGTPSLLGAGNLAVLIQRLSDIFDLSCLAEATIEVNPDTASEDLFKGALRFGFNRISLGVQALNDEELIKAGRIHNSAQALAALDMMKKSGISNISADLIIGLPGQDWLSLRNTVEQLVTRDIKHLSVYCLAIEEGTRFAQERPDNLPDDAAQAELYGRTRSYLTQSGFLHYEISNYCRPGWECRHNLNYWRGGDYIGLGPSAASHLSGCRYKNSHDLEGYLVNPLGLKMGEEQLEVSAKLGEEAMLRLRLLEEGLDCTALVPRYGAAANELRQRLDRLVERRMLARRNSRYCIPANRILTSNPVLAELLA